MILGFFQPERPTAVVRRAEVADAPAIAQIHARAFARPWSLIDIEAMLTDRAVSAHLIGRGTRGAAPEGFILSRIIGDEAEVLSIAVDPAHRGHGLSRLLLDRHAAALAALGVRWLHLEVEEGNAPALALYRRDFTTVGRREAYYPRPDGGAAAAILMRRDLAG